MAGGEWSGGRPSGQAVLRAGLRLTGDRPGAPLQQTGAGPEREGAAGTSGLVWGLPESLGHLCSSSLS